MGVVGFIWVVGSIRASPGGRRVHKGSLGLFPGPLGFVRFIQARPGSR